MEKVLTEEDEDDERDSKRPHLDTNIFVKPETDPKYGTAALFMVYMIQVYTLIILYVNVYTSVYYRCVY